MARTVGVYERLLAVAGGSDRAALAAAGHDVLAGLERLAPAAARELAGLAEGAGQPLPLLAAVNARTELLAAGPAAECSLVAAAGTLAQTWDWHPDLAPAATVWTVVQPGGRWFTTLTEAGILAKLGLSSAGVACGLNFLRTSADGGTGGLPIHVALRAVLERCETVADAVALLRSAPVTASSCVTLVADGAVVAAELSPGGCVLVGPDADGSLVHTNHFLGVPPAGRDLERDEGPGSVLRRDHLMRWLARHGFDPVALLRAHAPERQPVCRHVDASAPWAERRATLAAVILEPARGRFRVCAGAPCRGSFADVEPPR